MKTVKIIPSKSDAHRAFICAALSVLQERVYNTSAIFDGKSDDIFKSVICEETSEDIEATKSCLLEMMSPKADTVGVNLYCGESGATLRFLLPIVGALGIRGIFHPEGRLSKRPLSPLYEELIKHGMNISKPGSIPLISEGKLTPGVFTIPGNISSQFISGLMFALPLLGEDSEIRVLGELESAPYVDMTISTLKAFGISVVEERDKSSSSNIQTDADVERRFLIKGNQKYSTPEKYTVEGDWSNAAFWFAIGAIGNEPIRVEGLNFDSLQGDRHILDVLKKFGVKIEIGEDASSSEGSRGACFVTVYPSSKSMKAITYDVMEVPDMVPVISVLGAVSKGVTRIQHAGRLRIKESDRLHSISVNLKKTGVKIDELEDGLIIHGIDAFKPSEVESHGDHRLAMMTAVQSVYKLEGGGRIRLIGYDAAKKSYPTFFEKLSELELDSGLELV